jgi:hypothetical protein
MDSLVLADQKEKGIYNLVTAFTLAEDDRFGFAFPKKQPHTRRIQSVPAGTQR